MASNEGSWLLEWRPQGWARLSEEGGEVRVYLQYLRDDGGRLRLHSVVMASDAPLSVRTWRRIPFAQLENMLNLFPQMPSPTDETPAPDLAGLDSFFEATAGDYRNVKAHLADVLEGQPSGDMPLVKAPNGRLTTEFFEELASAYTWLVDAQRPPAPAIAEMANVPVRTVHRWISEARSRGFLPPAQRGRAG